RGGRGGAPAHRSRTPGPLRRGTGGPAATARPDPAGGPAAAGHRRVRTRTRRRCGGPRGARVRGAVGGSAHLVAAADLGLLRDALGLPLPPGAPESATEPGRDPLTQLVLRHARTHAPFTTAQVASAFRLGTATAELVLER